MKEEIILKTKYNGNIYMIRHIYQLQMKKTQKKEFTFFYNVIQTHHWGVFRALHETEWLNPIKKYYPIYSKEFNKKAIKTEFMEDETEDGASIQIMLPRGKGFENTIGGIISSFLISR